MSRRSKDSKGRQAGGKKERGIKYIPPEIIEEILLNLPIISLCGFSFVSKLWNSIIFGSCFLKKYRSREILIGTNYCQHNVSTVSTQSYGLSENLNPRTLICPIGKNPILLAFCDELWCVEVNCGMVDPSLFLWNPSIQTYRKLRDPVSDSDYICGLGYDAVADDYKMLKIDCLIEQVELYSLRSDSWRKIQTPQQVSIISFYRQNGVFVNGALHWIGWGNPGRAIISFDLSTETFREVAGPEHLNSLPVGWASVSASKGKLCVCLYSRAGDPGRFVMLSMGDYGIVQSWTKICDINFDLGLIEGETKKRYNFTHLYSYDDGRILIKASYGTRRVFVFVCEGNRVLSMINDFHNLEDCILHVESLVSPKMW